MTGHERRAAATKEAIKDAMLDLLREQSYNEIGVAALCRKACIGRATFYTHYTGLSDVIDELADDAINATVRSSNGLFDAFTLAEKMRSTTDPQKLAPYMDLLPVCQRVADHPKYRPLFFDLFVSDYILARIIRRERKDAVNGLVARYNITEDEANELFLFMVSGAFAVNKSLRWKKDETWYRTQKVLLTFLEGGHAALHKL